MRATIQIVGMGDRMTGTSKKTGKAYDIQNVSFLYPDKFTIGMKAATTVMDGAEVEALGGLRIGQEYDAVFHTGPNGAVYIDAIIC